MTLEWKLTIDTCQDADAQCYLEVTGEPTSFPGDADRLWRAGIVSGCMGVEICKSTASREPLLLAQLWDMPVGAFSRLALRMYVAKTIPGLSYGIIAPEYPWYIVIPVPEGSPA